MSTDLSELFETGLGPEPVLPPARERVVVGRRALRRRRLVSGSLVAATIAGVALGMTQLGSSEPSSAPLPSKEVTADTRTPDEVRLSSAVPVDRLWTETCGRGGQPTCEGYTEGAAPVAIRADGTLTRIADDVVIMRRADDLVRPDGTREVEVELRTATYPRPCWYVLTRAPSGAVTARIADPAQSSIDFDTWVAALRSGTDDPGAPALQRERMLVSD
jgi:hypothetical protein